MHHVAGKWLLTPMYIEDSYDRHHWLGESWYEWGPKNGTKLPQEVQCLLSAPRRWREKLATAQSGAFSNWRVAILVEDQASKAIFRR